MAGVTEIRMRMNSVRDIMKITNAMYLISSSKLKKARKMLQATEPYFNKLQTTIHHILVHSPSLEHPYFEKEKEAAADHVPKRGFLVITADKGLAGAYNHNVIKLAESKIDNHCRNVIFPVGQMGRMYFAKKGYQLCPDFYYTVQNPDMYTAGPVANTLLDLYNNGELDEIYVVFTKMVTSMKCEAFIRKLLPLKKENFLDEELPFDGSYTTNYVPDEHTVLNYLVPNYVKGLIFGALVESFSSEHNERMMAMDAATTSAKDMIKELSLQYNRARQAEITQEITEISSGAKSLGK